MSFSTNNVPTKESSVKISTFSEVLTQQLLGLGIEFGFGISGGAIAPLWIALEYSEMRIIHCRHEAGAGFAATEAYFANGKPETTNQ